MKRKEKDKNEKNNANPDEPIKVVDKRSSVESDNASEPTSEDRALKKPSYVEKLLEEIDEQKKQLLELSKAFRSVQKDSEEFRLRLNKDVEKRVFKGKIEFSRDFIEVLDNLERGLESAEKIRDFDSFFEGIKLVISQFLQKIQKNDIKEIKSAGEDFNPKFHEALSTTPVEEKDKDNKVVEVIEKGYLIKDEILRPSKVIVGKFDGK